MRITDTAIKYRTSVVVLTLLLSIGGLYSYSTIPKEASPSIEIPNIVITTIYPGASPSDVESLITQHIEREVQSVNGLKQIRSTSTEGVSSIIAEFDPDISIDEAFQKTRDRVDLAKPDLPTDVEEPIVSEIDFSEFPILTINLAANYPLTRLKEVAEELEDELESVPGVLEVDVIGALEREVQINVDLNALKGYNLTFNDVITTIRQENINLPGGSVDVDRMNYLVRIDGEIADPAEIENLVVKTPGGTPIYVRDIAEVDFGFKDRGSYARLQALKIERENGGYYDLPDAQSDMRQVISLNVKQRSGDNILETVAGVEAMLETFPMPSGTQVAITGDQSVFVEELITDLENNIISGLFFVIAVLLFFLGVRNAVLVGIAIPLSMFISFIVLQALGYTLNFIILFSLIIALGMLVDNAIVIVENIYRFREEGHSRLEAARLATAEVAGAVIASTATTVAVFAPMLFWPGIIGEFMSYMPLTLIITLVCSLFVAIIINPVITGIFIRLEGEETPPWKRPAKYAALGIVAVAAVLIGLANWRTLVVLVVAAPTLYFAHIYLFKPTGDRFVRSGLPKMIARYRQFLGWMLTRDYTPKRALLRNTFALGSLTLGLVLLVAGSLVQGFAGQMAGLVLMVPGGLLTVLGLIGVVVHSIENVIVALSGGLSADNPKFYILTDNRARLLNSVIGGLLFIVALFAVFPTGVEFFPETDPRQVRVTAEGPLGMNIEASNTVAREMETRIQALLNENPASQSNIQNVLVNVGVGGDADFGGGAASPERSRVTLNIVDYATREESSMNTLTRLRDQLQGIPGVSLEFGKDESGPPTGAPVNIEVTGPQFDEISRITRDLTNMLTEAAATDRIPGLVDVANNLNTGRPELKVRIDRERAARFGLNTNQIATTVRAAINGIEAGKYRDGEDEYDITVRLQDVDRADLESLGKLTILEEGIQVPLLSVADFEIVGGLGSITRLDLQRVSTVSGEAAPGFNGQAILGQVKEYLAAYEQDLSPGYTLSYTGESEDQQESFSFLTTVFLIGISLIFMIMVAEFNHVSSPFIIMVAVGFGLIGVMLGLILTRTPFGLMTFIGVISLAGIIVNNNIVLVDYIMQLRDRGLDKRAAIIEGGATRMRPVLLTALTTVLGLIPLTFGLNLDFVGLLTRLDPNFQFGSENTQFWGPMGTAIISGLIFATFLTLVIVPVMYSVFDSLADRLGAAFSNEEAPGGHAPEGGDGFTPTPPAGTRPAYPGTATGNGGPAKTVEG